MPRTDCNMRILKQKQTNYLLNGHIASLWLDWHDDIKKNELH